MFGAADHSNHSNHPSAHPADKEKDGNGNAPGRGGPPSKIPAAPASFAGVKSFVGGSGAAGVGGGENGRGQAKSAALFSLLGASGAGAGRGGGKGVPGGAVAKALRELDGARGPQPQRR